MFSSEDTPGIRRLGTKMFLPGHEALLLWSFAVVGRDVLGRHAYDLGFGGRSGRSGRRDCAGALLCVRSVVVVGVDQDLGDLLFGGLEEAEHRCTAGGFGFAGQGAWVG